MCEILLPCSMHMALLSLIVHAHSFTHMQKNSLENELHHIKEQLTLSSKEMELLKSERERKDREQLAAKQKFQDKLQQLQRVGLYLLCMLTCNCSLGSKLEILFVQECNELAQRASVETQLKNTHAEEIAELQTELERDKTSRQKEVQDMSAQHSAEIQHLVAEHSRKVHPL